MIAIKGAEMPKHCMTCEFHDQMYNRCNIGHFETGAKFIKGDDKWYFKHPNCPLVEIVTCEECEHWHDDGVMTTCDKNIGHGFPRDHYCADAKRREQK